MVSSVCYNTFPVVRVFVIYGYALSDLNSCQAINRTVNRREGGCWGFSPVVIECEYKADKAHYKLLKKNTFYSMMLGSDTSWSLVK